VDLIVLLGPTRIAIFLTTFRSGGVELIGTLTILDSLILLARVSLTRSIDKTGIHDAAFFGDEALAGESLVEGLEEFLAPLALVFFNEFFEAPNRIGIGHLIAETQSQKAHETEAILDLSFGGLVTEAMVVLQNKDLEHGKRIKRWAASFLPIFCIVAGDRFEYGAKTLPVNQVTEFQNPYDTLSRRFLMVQRSKEIPTPVRMAILSHAESQLPLSDQGIPMTRYVTGGARK